MMDRRKEDIPLQEIYRFMGELRAYREHWDTMLEIQAEQIEDMKREQVETRKILDEMSNKIVRWESKLGTFIFIAGCLWTAFITFKDNILAFIKG